MVGSVTDVRPSPLAGKWYPNRADDLIATIERFLNGVGPTATYGKILGLLAPHAGYRYSGPVAAHAFTLVKDLACDTVVIIGPMHHPYPGTVLTTSHGAYGTPLGEVRVDQEILEALSNSIRFSVVRNDPEHSVEIELPFLQYVLKPGFSLVPIMLRDQSASQARTLGAALAELLQGREVLFVASSDLSHFYPQDVANQYDNMMLACVESMDADCVVEYNESRTAFACGYGAIATVINAVRIWNADHARVVGYGTSGDVTGDFREVVGYGAVVFSESA